MNVLIVNDDGIRAEGILHLVEAMTAEHVVYVCAPEGQRSAASHSITIRKPVDIREVEYPGAEAALQTSGTPADCAKIGLQFFADRGVRIDAVVSGINHGSNLGIDTLYSGTVGAAMEAAISGVHAVAVSVVGRAPVHFDTACGLALQAVRSCTTLDPRIVVDINCPDLPAGDVKGVRLTRLAWRNFNDRFEKSEDGLYRLTGVSQEKPEDPALDLASVLQGYCSVTPISYDLTAGAYMDAIGAWGLSV